MDFKFLQLSDRFRQRVYHKLDAVQRVRVRATNRQVRKEVDAVPYTVTECKIYQEHSKFCPLFGSIPNVGRIVLKAKNLRYEVIFVFAQDMGSSMAIRKRNGKMIGILNVAICNIHSFTSAFAVKMLTHPSMHYELVDITTLSPPNIPARQCSADRVIITQGSSSRHFATVADWLMLFRKPIADLTLTIHYHFSNGIFEAENLRTALKAYVDGHTNILPSFYAKIIDMPHFTHVDTSMPREAIIEALTMHFQKISEMKDRFFKYVGKHWTPQQAEELLKSIKELEKGVIISRSMTMASLHYQRNGSIFLLRLLYDTCSVRQTPYKHTNKGKIIETLYMQ